MRADTEALMARLTQAEQALLDTRLGCVEGGTTCGRSHDWQGANVHKRSQRLARVVIPVHGIHGVGNPKSIEALRWAAMEGKPIKTAAAKEQGFEDHNPQLCLALSTLRKESVLEIVKSTEGSNVLEAWRGLNATYDCYIEGRQRVLMQCLLQPKRPMSG